MFKIKKSKKQTSRTRKTLNKGKGKQGFKPKWWMGLILVVIVGGVGLAVLHFSQASQGKLVFRLNCSTVPGQCDDPGYRNQFYIKAGLLGQPGKPLTVCYKIAYGHKPELAQANVTLRISETGYRHFDTATRSFVSGRTDTACVPYTIPASPVKADTSIVFFIKTNEPEIRLVEVTGYLQDTPSAGGTVPSTPAPSAPSSNSNFKSGASTPSAPPVDPNRQTLSFPAGNLVTTCKYRSVSGHALVCPEGNWQFIGLGDGWTGTWEQNKAKGATDPTHVGYWKQGNFCGVRSRITGNDPRLDFQSNSHMYLVGCPSYPVYTPETLSFPAGKITTTCGYRNVKGHALICPERDTGWKFISQWDGWTGTWEQNKAKGATDPTHVGYWKQGNFCGVRSRITGDNPRLDFHSKAHMYLVGCPAPQAQPKNNIDSDAVKKLVDFKRTRNNSSSSRSNSSQQTK